MLRNKWLITVSVKVLGSFISEMVLITSALILPLSFTYSSNTLINDLIKSSLFSLRSWVSLIILISASKKGVKLEILFIKHLCLPSIKTLTVPSGNFNNCRILPMVPVLYKSFSIGSSIEDFFWVIRIISLLPSITDSKAFIDFDLPTKSGAIICGNITISLKGNTG